MTEDAQSTASSFAHALRRHRRAAGLTQARLAERAGISERAVSDLERGEKRAPRRDTLDLLATALGLSAEDRADLERAARLAHAAKLPSAAPDAPVTGAPSGDGVAPLPPQPTPFIGREREVAAVRARLLDGCTPQK